MLYKANADCIKALQASDELVIKNLMGDVFRHYKVEA
mgnify:FL=1